MKRSKRLLSILLMLVMLVSSLTVMAFAGDTVTFNIVVNNADKGTVKLQPLDQEVTTKAYVFNKESVGELTLVATPKDSNYEATVAIDGGAPVKLGSGMNLDAMLDGHTLTVDFVQTSSGSEETDKDYVELTIKPVLNDVKGAKVLLGASKITSELKGLAIYKEDLEKGVSLSTSADVAYTVTWSLNGETVGTDDTYTLPKNLKGKDNVLTVTFAAKAAPVVTHTLTINVPKVDKKVAGTVKYNGVETPKIDDLKKGDTRTLVAEAKEGYEFQGWEVTGATVSDFTTATTTVTMGDTDATITAKFVKKTTPVDTFKLTIEKVGTDGKVYYRLKGEKNWTEVKGDTTISGLKKNDSYEVKAEPNKNCEATWKIDNKTATVASNQKTFKITDADISVKITFTKIDTKNLKLSVDLDERHGDLKYYDNDKGKWVTYDDESWTLSKGDKVEFKAVPDSDYKAVWQLGSGDKTSATYYDVTYKDMDGKNRTLHVDFVKKGTTVDDNYPSLTFDITGGKHGTVTRNNNYKVSDGDVISIKKNDTRTFEAKPDKGYVAVWTFQGETYVGNKYTLKMGSKDATLYIEFMDEDDYRLTKLPFRDVSERDWYYDDVVYVYRNGLMEGVSSTKFAGSQNTTRGQIVTILWRLTGEPRAAKENKFTDVSYDAYYNKAISWAAEAGIVEGFDAKTFKPDQNVTREQLAAILYRYASYMNLSTKGASNLTKFDDYNKIGTWARDAMAWANYHGLINGVSYSRIDPKGYATRAQIAAILHRFAVEFGV